MNIVHYLPRIRLEEGGVVRAVLDICTLTAARGHSVSLITHEAADAPRSWTPRIEIVPRPTLPGSLFSPGSLRGIRPLVGACDALHLHTPWERANVQLAALARRLGKPYVLSIHGMLDDWCMTQRGAKKRLYLALAGRRLLEGAAAVHCTAEAEKTQSQRWYPRGRPVVIPLVFDLADFRALPGPEPALRKFAPGPPSGPIVLFLSRLHPKKGVEHLVEAGALLMARGVAFSLLVAGTGERAYEDSLRALADRRGLGERVKFLGLVTGVEKVSLFQAAEVFVLPTSQENFGFVIPEALACGTPVVTTKGVDIWPDLQSSGAAMIVDPATPAALADAIAGLLAEPARRAQMGRAGREWVFRTLDPEEVVRGYEAMYERAAGARPLLSPAGPAQGR